MADRHWPQLSEWDEFRLNVAIEVFRDEFVASITRYGKNGSKKYAMSRMIRARCLLILGLPMNEVIGRTKVERETLRSWYKRVERKGDMGLYREQLENEVAMRNADDYQMAKTSSVAIGETPESLKEMLLELHHSLSEVRRNEAKMAGLLSQLLIESIEGEVKIAAEKSLVRDLEKILKEAAENGVRPIIACEATQALDRLNKAGWNKFAATLSQLTDDVEENITDALRFIKRSQTLEGIQGKVTLAEAVKAATQEIVERELDAGVEEEFELSPEEALEQIKAMSRGDSDIG